MGEWEITEKNSFTEFPFLSVIYWSQGTLILLKFSVVFALATEILLVLHVSVSMGKPGQRAKISAGMRQILLGSGCLKLFGAQANTWKM